MELGQAYDKIYQYAYFKLHNSHLAEDITQETFLRYLNSSERRGGYEMRYLYTIAKNLCIDAFRKAKHETFAEERIDEPFFFHLTIVVVGNFSQLHKIWSW